MTTQIADMSRFTSRLRYKGQLVFDTAHRIGAGTSFAVDAPSLPVLRTADGDPYIPGSSFKGAWRSYTEAVLRTLQAQPGTNKLLACNPLHDKSKLTNNDSALGQNILDPMLLDLEEHRCVPTPIVKYLKDTHQGDDKQAALDAVLRERSCLTCRVFGNNVVSSKAMTRDLFIREESFLRTQIRDGVAIDRDAARAADGMKYTVEVVPAGAAFDLEIVIENGTDAELGLALLGLRAFERGEIQMGGGRSRGLGWCHIEPDWDASEFVTADNLLDHLLGTVAHTGDTEAEATRWLAAFGEYVRTGTDA